MARTEEADSGDVRDMQDNRTALIPPPQFIPCDPLSRYFPAGWKDYYFRACGKPDLARGYVYYCPICQKGFDHSEIDFLEGDHIWPYSMFGETSWENYQLICGSCNASKTDFVEHQIRSALGAGDFRRLIVEQLGRLREKGLIADSALLRQLLG
jgi:5-methylcytosine-specific restriction endonuclease McrA